MSCGCNNPCTTCGQSPCGCNRSPGCGPLIPTPFYGAVGGCCPEQHCNPQLIPGYSGVKVSDSFNMPGCGQSAAVSVPNLLGLPVGSYLWNVGVGYLKVISVNLLDQTILLQNDCTAGNITPGSTIAACTTFVVTVPPPIAGTSPGQGGIFVAIDFTAPNVGVCLIITVTAVTGLSVGKNVAIGSGVYRVQSIPSATLLEICNDGAGITPGSSVIAKNGSGQFQYPITLIDTNACTNAAVLEGKLLVCKDGITQPLIGTTSQVPVAQDNDGNVKMMTLDVPTRTCTTIICCLTLVPGTFTYVIEVSSSADFLVGDVFQIGTRTDRWTVNVILDATHITATTNTNPAVIETIALATSLCLIDCCEDLQLQVNELQCAYQVVTDTLPLFYAVNNIVLDVNGYMSLRLDGGSLYNFDPGEGCTTNFQVTAHLFVGVWTDPINYFGAPGVNPGINPFVIYNEVEAVWDTGAIPLNDRAGKMVWTETMGGHVVAYPLDIASLFNQAPGTDPAAFGVPLTYHGNFIKATAEIDNTQNTDLNLYFRTLPSTEYPPLFYDGTQFGVYVVGHIEIKRYNVI